MELLALKMEARPTRNVCRLKTLKTERNTFPPRISRRNASLLTPDYSPVISKSHFPLSETQDKSVVVC